MKSTATLARSCPAGQARARREPIRPQSHGDTELRFLGVPVALWLKNNAFVAYPTRELLPVEIFKKRNRVLSGEIQQILELSHPESGPLRILGTNLVFDFFQCVVVVRKILGYSYKDLLLEQPEIDLAHFFRFRGERACELGKRGRLVT